MNIGQAVEALKRGNKVQRSNWNGENMWLIFVPSSPDLLLDASIPYGRAGLDYVTIDAHIDMYTAQGTMQPGWLASQADLLAEDWGIVT